MDALEVYVADCCGGVFIPGYGPDNLVDDPFGSADALRDGDCPSCGEICPELYEVEDDSAED